MDMSRIQAQELLNNKVSIDPNFLAFGACNHQYQLNNPISENELTSVEQTLGGALPTEYRNYQLNVSNGGAGAGYGLLKLSRAVDKIVYRHPKSLVYTPPPPCDLLPLSDHGCGSMTFIAISGKELGEIWEFDDLLFCYLPVLNEPENLSDLYNLPAEQKELQIDKLLKHYRSLPKAAKLTFNQWHQSWLEATPFIPEGAEQEHAENQAKDNAIEELLAPLHLSAEDKNTYTYYTEIKATQRVLLTDDDGMKVSLWCLKTGKELTAFVTQTSELYVDNIVSASGNWLICSIEEDYGNSQGAKLYIGYIGEKYQGKSAVEFELLTNFIDPSFEFWFDDNEHLWVNGMDHSFSTLEFCTTQYELNYDGQLTTVTELQTIPPKQIDNDEYHRNRLSPNAISIIREQGRIKALVKLKT